MKYYKKTFLIKQLLRSFKYFLFILIFSETNSRFRTQTLKSSSTFFFSYSCKTFNSVNSTNFEAFVSFSNSGSFYHFYNLFSKHCYHNIGWPQVLEFLEFRELFWIFFDTGNVLEEGHLIRIFMEMFLNLDFFVSCKIFIVAPFLKIFLDMHIKRLRFRNQFGFFKPVLHSC